MECGDGLAPPHGLAEGECPSLILSWAISGGCVAVWSTSTSRLMSKRARSARGRSCPAGSCAARRTRSGLGCPRSAVADRRRIRALRGRGRRRLLVAAGRSGLRQAWLSVDRRLPRSCSPHAHRRAGRCRGPRCTRSGVGLPDLGRPRGACAGRCAGALAAPSTDLCPRPGARLADGPPGQRRGGYGFFIYITCGAQGSEQINARGSPRMHWVLRCGGRLGGAGR